MTIIEVSKEHAYLAREWRTYEEINRVKDELDIWLAKFLKSLESEMTNFGWWDENWKFVSNGDEEIYIAHLNWINSKNPDEFLVWIGVQYFSARSLFGSEYACRYVWVNRNELISKKLRYHFQHDYNVITKGKDYVIKENLPHFPLDNDDFEKFKKLYRQEILEFFDKFAKQESVVTQAIRSCKDDE